MPSKNREKKKAIFKLFSQNLNWVKEHPEVNFVPNFTDGYICPICFDVFFEKDIDSLVSNPLTLEDTPPVSLGGKPLTLTCKSCNSKNGYELDAHLLKALLDYDSNSFLPNSETSAEFEIFDNKINGTFKMNDDGTAILNFQSHRSNPDSYHNFINLLTLPDVKYNPLFYPDKILNPQTKTQNFKMKFLRPYDMRRAEIALLRIAYLIAYSTFGSGFYINSGLYKVREQILNPDKVILPGVYWVKNRYPKELEGINIISAPRELQCFLVIFNLKTRSQTQQFAIALPGPSDPGLKVYDFIEKILCVGDGTEMFHGVIEHIASRSYLKSKDFAFASHFYWQKYTDINYQPNLPSEAKNK